jgi:hypothetical protein
MRGVKRTGFTSLLLLLGVGCGSGGAKPMGMDGSAGGDGGQQADAAGDVPVATDGATDGTGFEPAPLPYFYGTCRLFEAGSLVPTDRGPLPFGLTVLATGLPRTVALEVDATNFYLATSSALLRLPLSGGTPETMISGAAPVATAIDADNLYWIDGGVTGQTTILRAPLAATGWAAFPGDAGGAQTATMLAAMAGTPGPFIVAGGHVYFTVGNVVSRVPTGGGAVQMVTSGFTVTGMAVGGDVAYFGEYSNETIQRLSLTGTLPGVPSIVAASYASPTELAFNGGELYWGDWFGGVEYFLAATPTMGQRFATDCGFNSIPCEYRFRPGGRGAVWGSESGDCGSIGKVNPTGSELMAGGLASLGGLAATAAHAYATTSLGELLRLDL